MLDRIIKFTLLYLKNLFFTEKGAEEKEQVMSEKFLTPQELAERWRYKTDKRIYQLKEDIGFTRISGKILFPIEKVEEYERTHTVLPNEKGKD